MTSLFKYYNIFFKYYECLKILLAFFILKIMRLDLKILQLSQNILTFFFTNDIFLVETSMTFWRKYWLNKRNKYIYFAFFSKYQNRTLKAVNPLHMKSFLKLSNKGSSFYYSIYSGAKTINTFFGFDVNILISSQKIHLLSCSLEFHFYRCKSIHEMIFLITKLPTNST